MRSMGRRKKGLLIALGIVVLLLGGVFFSITSGLDQAVGVTVNPVDLSGIADGSYTGSYRFKRWSNTVRVEVQDHQIVNIEVVEDVGAAEVTACRDEMIRRVLEAQDTQVDAVSGATATSKAYLKAVEDALS